MPREPQLAHVCAAGSTKTYGLLGLIGDRAAIAAPAEPENELMAWPRLLLTELVLLLGVLAVLVSISILFNAPLEELANPSEPPNPAKAPWYFLGLQELVSYSALAGGVLTPLLVIFGLLMAIPYIDRDSRDVGVWFASTSGRRLAATTAILTLAAIPALIVLNARFGLRREFPNAPQLLVDLVNPATVTIFGIVSASLLVGIRTKSWRLGAIVVFTGFVVAYVVLTTVGTMFRGPNWAWAWPGGGI